MSVVVNPQIVILYDANGVELAVQDGVAIPVNTPAILIAGSDGTNAKYVRTAADGTVRVDPSGTTTQPISAASLPLPTNAATSTKQSDGSQKTQVVDASGNVHPAEDVAARAGFVKLTDGTNTAPTMDVAARAGFQKITDGTNTMPTMDAAARAGFVKAFGPDAEAAAPTQAPVRIAGWDGTDLRTLKTDTLGRLVMAATAGALNGFTDGQIVLASTTVTAVRSTTYTEPTSNAQRSVASNNANDTSAGTGARTIRITYYALSMGVITGPFTEDITLNGTSNVNTVATNICFIERIVVLTVGSTGSNVGIISLFGATGGGGGTVWTIAATANKTFGCHHYIPDGFTCKITGLLVGIKGADTTSGFLRQKNPTNANASEVQITDNVRAPSSGQNFRAYGTPIEVVGPNRVTGYVAPDSSSSRTYYVSFDFFEE